MPFLCACTGIMFPYMAFSSCIYLQGYVLNGIWPHIYKRQSISLAYSWQAHEMASDHLTTHIQGVKASSQRHGKDDCVHALNVHAVGQHPDPFKHIANEFRQIRAEKTHAKLVDANQLPRRQAAVRKVDDMFWRQSTSAYAQPAAGSKKRRKQTLGKAPRKAARVAKPGRQPTSALCLLHSKFAASEHHFVMSAVLTWVILPADSRRRCCAAGILQMCRSLHAASADHV